MEVANLVSSLFATTTTTWLSVCPELAFLVRYGELHQLVADGQLRHAVDLLLDLLSADHGQQPVKNQQHLHLPLHFRLHLVAQVRPYLEEKENKLLLDRDQLDTLIAVTAELQTTIELLLDGRGSGGDSFEQLSAWFLGLNALLAQARAKALLFRPTLASSEGGDPGPFDEVGSEYAATES